MSHEFGHTITKAISDITPGPDPFSDAQSAAIDEGYADISAVHTELFWGGSVLSPATWIISEVFANGKGVRNLSNPKDGLTSIEASASRDWFPVRMLGHADNTRHANSTIMSHAFKLLTTGGFHARAGQPVGPLNGGNTIPFIVVPSVTAPIATSIFYTTLQQPAMRVFPTFPIMKDTAQQVAASMYGPATADAVRLAFEAVGIGNACTAPPPPPALQLEDLLCRGRYMLSWPATPTATTYHGQTKPAGWPWDLAQTIIDGNFNQCNQQVSQTTSVRLRACNGCGCSDWSPSQTMQWWPQCL